MQAKQSGSFQYGYVLAATAIFGMLFVTSGCAHGPDLSESLTSVTRAALNSRQSPAKENVAKYSLAGNVYAPISSDFDEANAVVMQTTDVTVASSGLTYRRTPGMQWHYLGGSLSIINHSDVEWYLPAASFSARLTADGRVEDREMAAVHVWPASGGMYNLLPFRTWQQGYSEGGAGTDRPGAVKIAANSAVDISYVFYYGGMRAEEAEVEFMLTSLTGESALTCQLGMQRVDPEVALAVASNPPSLKQLAFQ